MRVMVIDTALSLCSAGVFDVVAGLARPLGLRSEVMTKGHQERLAVLAQEAVVEAGGFAAIERIGVTVGPGSFTGLRVGLAFAQGLGAALDCPVVGLSTLDALAASVPESGNVAALIDARRGQVYARFWIEGQPQGEPQALSIDAAMARVADLGSDTVMVGSGAVLIGGEGRAAIQHRDGPSPDALARLTAASNPPHAAPKPLYLRAPDATPPSRLPGQPRSPRA